MKYTCAEIAKELVNRGYEATEDGVVKNSVELDAVVIRNNTSIGITIYPEKLNMENLSLSETVDKMVEIIETCPELPFDTDKLQDADFVRSHVMMGVQRISTQNLIKRNSTFEGIETYLYIRMNEGIGESFTMKLTEDNIPILPITMEDAWKNAKENTFKEMEIKDMMTLMNELMGIDTDSSQNNENDNPVMLVVSNKYRTYGAVAMLDGKILKTCAEMLDTHNIYVIPSSIHEIIVTSADRMDLDEVNVMVQTVNEQEVLAEEVLSDKAYLVHIN